MSRITMKALEAVVARLNRVTGSPAEAWTTPDSDPRRMVANIGHYYVDGAYGGVALYRMANEQGGVSDVFRVGHVPKARLYDLMHAYLRGFEEARAEARPLLLALAGAAHGFVAFAQRRREQLGELSGEMEAVDATIRAALAPFGAATRAEWLTGKGGPGNLARAAQSLADSAD